MKLPGRISFYNRVYRLCRPAHSTAVSDGPEGFEHRRFECLKCTVTEIRTLASDPIKSNAVHWLSSELRQPD